MESPATLSGQPTADRPAAGPADEQQFLSGPRPRAWEALSTVRFFLEFFRGYRALHFVGPCVTVFGSARFGEGTLYYDMGRSLGRELAKVGFTVMTGGGPGIMEAANRGAKEARGTSIGCAIALPNEEPHNAYVDRLVRFEHFFVRKVMLVKYSYAFVALPGGLGTLDEVFEAATLIQTGKIRDFPIVLMGSDYWQPLIDFMRETQLAAGAIDQRDVDRLILTDDAAVAAGLIRDAALRTFGLKYIARPKRRRLLWER